MDNDTRAEREISMPWERDNKYVCGTILKAREITGCGSVRGWNRGEGRLFGCGQGESASDESPQTGKVGFFLKWLAWDAKNVWEFYIYIYKNMSGKAERKEWTENQKETTVILRIKGSFEDLGGQKAGKSVQDKTPAWVVNE